MKYFMKFLTVILIGACLFASRAAAADTRVILNPGDRIFTDRYIVALPNTPLIYNGVIYYPDAALTNAYINTEPAGTVAAQVAIPSPGSSYMIVGGRVYQLSPPQP